MEKDCVARQKLLDVREVRDAEEKKKRLEDEEDNRYEYGGYGQTNRLGMGISKQKTKLSSKSTTAALIKTGPSRKVVGSLTTTATEKTPTKRKVMTGT
jgi:hypothetical protein